MNDQICLPYELLRLQGSPIEGFFFIWVFPWLFLLGMIGNSLNLMVLLSPKRPLRRPDSLLLSLALCDMLFLLLLLPSAMAQFDQFGQHPQFRVIYLTLRVHLIGFANWCSAVAIWLIIAICADRLLGIRSLRRPQIADSSTGGTCRLVLGIVFITGLLTSYNHFSFFPLFFPFIPPLPPLPSSYHCVLRWLRDGGQVVGKCFDVLQESWPGNHTNRTPHHLRAYVRWSLAANALLVVLLPILLMLLLNAALLLVVRRHSFPQAKCASMAKSNGFRPSSNIRPTNQQADHRVTVSVAAIVSAFTLTQGPSALLLVARLALADGEWPDWPGWPVLGSLTGFLVVLGKSLNCVLLCLSSASFRRRLALTLRGKRRGEFGRRQSSAGSATAMCQPGMAIGGGTARRWSRGRGRSHSLP